MNAPTVYDAVPYPTGTYAQTHPDRLATIATLFGMSPAPVDRCRVLEVGCGTGGNLIPMAFALPGSEFVGIDLAATAVAQGRVLIDRVGLKNIALLEKDLTQVTPDVGTFDYIIAHGIYAWVAPPVQDALLALCGALLAPQGVAFVSYNAYPGSHLRDMIREMMLYHVRGVADPGQRLAQAKELLGFLCRTWTDPGDVRYWVGKQGENALQRDRDTLYHDELAEEFRPVYFHQFAAHAGRHGLQYLGESDFFTMGEGVLPPASVETIRQFGPDQILAKEQYMDFLKCRSFRQTLLCRKAVPLQRGIPPSIVERLLVETRVHPPVPSHDPESPEEVEYRTSKGATMSTGSVRIKRLMAQLGKAWPGPVPFRELAAGQSAPEFADFILKMYDSQIVDLRTWAPPFILDVRERPEASRLARVQLEVRGLATNLRHIDLNLEDTRLRTLIRLLDGTRDRAALLRDLSADGKGPVAPTALDGALLEIARLALLTA